MGETIDPQGTPVAPRKNRVIKANNKTPAAKYNTVMVQRIVETLKQDPEADLVTIIGKDYAKKRELFQNVGARLGSTTKKLTVPNPSPGDTRLLLDPDEAATILSPFSEDMLLLLPNIDVDNLMHSVIQLLSEAEVIFQTKWGCSTMILLVSDGIVTKISRRSDGTDEYTALQYLEEHLPSFPAPRPHGMIELEHFYLMFMTYIPGLDLEKAWPQLNVAQKQDISSQLDALFSELRLLPCLEDSPLGGAQGELCKDARRGLRVASTPITSVKEFEDFVFSGSRSATPVYLEFLRGLCPPSPNKSVFTHGDVRPANIVVDSDDSGKWQVTGIIDWERSGFYPEYWESIKITNCLYAGEDWDWYKYLPGCLHPKNHAQRWLLDLAWDPMVASIETSL
ncbi:kinase-like domain-containing protein [Annulohypoxylon maeteangense]|uniref:kinase-like domain-containing protein n=1 Tax=Annulohypoxylon maeteangense TaxID=1927788 RepID=UPI002007936E|nr:kinase-like domain-containing protein [Annulohypoxylon maeteangense]KAI0888288.1 kinase-like domain-containing protein [Annulohypoxylon maeteangense]